VDVNEVIREMIVLLGNGADRYSVAIRTNLAVNLPQVIVDRVQLQQVFMNLMLNGIEAMKEVNAGRELTIKSEQAQNSHLLISVSDTGVGLAPEQAEQIFRAFFYHQARRYRHGTADQPFHRRVARWPLVGYRQLRPGHDVPLHADRPTQRPSMNAEDSPSVFIIDDDPGVRAAIQGLLKSVGLLLKPTPPRTSSC
jgi:hypothetical protein